MNCILAALKYILKIARYAISKKRGEVKRGEVMEKEGMEIGKGRVGVVDFP